MTDSEQSPSRIEPAPDEMHWGINYLREDLRDHRAEARDFRLEMKAEHAALRAEAREFQVETRSEFAALRIEMAALRDSLLKHIDTRLYWAVGLMATMMGMQAALTTALIKL